jgi:hypothetical protein
MVPLENIGLATRYLRVDYKKEDFAAFSSFLSLMLNRFIDGNVSAKCPEYLFLGEHGGFGITSGYYPSFAAGLE